MLRGAEREVAPMAKFLVTASYSPQGLEGVLRSGGTARRDAVSKAVADLGGTMESFHFAFGESDAYVVVELPDNVAAAALGMAVSATGMASTRTVVLLTPEEIDRAARTETHYQPPGS
jgi:uncharacterized protein with GYD domain